jgi:phytol kinase
VNPWLAVALVLTILGGLIIGLRFFQRRYDPHPELVRKLLHVPMGLITLTFPWLFNSPVPVLVLAGIAIATLSLLRLYPPLQQSFGSVLGSVERRSLGEIYFPISVALVFWFSQGQPLLFCIPILLLTLADAIAAIIGIRYGKFRYTTTDGYKSAEGSIAFFTVAFFSIHIPLLLMSDTGRAETLLVSLILGLLVMLLEAIAWRGIDNLLIPVGGFILLKTHLSMSVPDLSIRLILTLVLVSFVLCWRNRTTLNDGALLGTALFGYLSWTLGGWLWLLPPLILFITYPFLIAWVDQEKTPLSSLEQKIMPWLPTNPHSQPRQWERIHSVHIVLSVSAAGALWLTLFGIFDRSAFLYPYTLAFAANLAVIGVAGLSPVNYWRSPHLFSVAGYILKAWILLFTPLFLVTGFSMMQAIIGLAVTSGVAIAYYLTQPYLRHRSTDTVAWFCRAIYTTLGSLLGALLTGLFAPL